MKKLFFTMLTVGAMLLVACDPKNNPDVDPGKDTIPTPPVDTVVPPTPVDSNSYVYSFNNDMTPGTALAGTRDDVEHQIYGSELMLVSSAYLQQGYLVQSAEWLLNSGKLTFTPTGFTVEAKSLAGHPVVVVFNGTVQNQGLQRNVLANIETEPEAPTRVKMANEFPKKHILEHFTGEECGYCPGGYDAIYEYTEKNPNVIWISHHKGFSDDEYTVTGSASVVTVNGVDGAPSCSLDRSAVKFVGGQSTASKPAFHPAYLPELTSTLEETTYASVVIDNEYDAASRKLTVKVTGEVLDTTVTTLKLSVIAKESGMKGHQKDYLNTFEGWEEYVHVHVVRAFLTKSSLGDYVTIDTINHTYEAVYETTLKDGWIPENMSVVAYLTNNKNRPVIQAEVAPVVAGTNGGAHVKPEGTKLVPVSDIYPENGKSLASYNGSDTVYMSAAVAYYYSYPADGFNYWTIQAQGSNVIRVDNAKCVPFLMLNFFTSTSETKVPRPSATNASASNANVSPAPVRVPTFMGNRKPVYLLIPDEMMCR